MPIPEILISWYHENKRDLPWRNTRDPYRIWLSEVILQQTRVNQGLNYYLRFLERFPDVNALAVAEEEEVLKLWQGLGYYSRARNLHEAARSIVKHHNGTFPGNYRDLLKLKGIGEYTAAAIASIAFGEPVAVVDGNVARVLSRLFAIEEAVNTVTGIKVLKQVASELIPPGDPATFNQAIMEFGALLCKPKNPSCMICPIKDACQAFQTGRVNDLPVKEKKAPVRVVYLNYLVLLGKIKERDHVMLNKREKKGLWKNLYDFPSIESYKEATEEEVIKQALEQGILDGNPAERLSVSGIFHHQLTHRLIKARFFRISLLECTKPRGSCKWVPYESLHSYPIPRLIENYLGKVR